MRKNRIGPLLCAWAVFITYLFLAPPQWSLLPAPLFAQLDHGPTAWLRPAGHGAAQFSILAAALSPRLSWNWMVGADTWIELAIGAAGLAAMTLVGWLVLACFRVYAPRGAALALCFAAGVGACGVPFTLLALAGRLTHPNAFIVYGFLVVALSRAAHRAPLRWLRTVPDDQVGVTWREQRRQALAWERGTWFAPTGRLEKALAGVLVALFSAITFFTFYHAVFYPETYWDSLILYLGYARGIYLEHGFPVKVVLQVGVGLGANYPHLYELTGAVIAAWADRWSPLYLQLAAPLAGLLTLVLAYHTALRVTRSVLGALAVTVLLRSTIDLITYHEYASNYSFAMLYAAMFFYCATRYLDEGLPGFLALAALAAAFGVQINYLMGVLWLAWGALVVMAHWPRRTAGGAGSLAAPDLGSAELTEAGIAVAEPPAWCRPPHPWPRLRDTLATRAFWAMFLGALAIASVWYVRNWIVTGNPVYAFFAGIFRGTKNLNPEVLASANREWTAHGLGIHYYDPPNAEHLPMLTLLWHRLAGTWYFFVNNGDGKLRTCWLWAPGVVALALPGAVLCAAAWLRRAVRREGEPATAAQRLGAVALFYAGILFAYHYTIGPFYMYHLLACFAAFAVFMALAVDRCGRRARVVLAAWVTLCAVVPGLSMALACRKITDPAGAIQALRNPGMPAPLFYRLRYGEEPRMWAKVNELCQGEKLLTHENRHLLFDPTITLVHLDDWDIQQIWDLPAPERLERLKKLGIHYYLRVPFEFDHPVNGRLGLQEWVDNGTLREVFRVGGQDEAAEILYRFSY